MNEVIPFRQSQAVVFTGKQLDLIKKTVASDCNNDEFDLFMEVAKSRGLNPFLKQIYAFVYSKDDPKKRKMSIVTAIDGYRIIAARCRDYRPSDTPTDFITDESVRCSENPAGIVKAVSQGYKFGPDGKWYPVIGEAFWDEYVPIKEEIVGGFDWVETGQTWPDGKPKKKKQPRQGAELMRVPDNLWSKMPHGQIAKCAEAQMLRKGWPEDFSGVYVSEEMDRARFEDRVASEIVETYEADKRQQLVGSKNSIFIQWSPEAPLEAVPLGQFADKATAFAKSCTTLPDLVGWADTNRVALKDFWAKSKSDALELKKVIEARQAEIAEANKIS